MLQNAFGLHIPQPCHITLHPDALECYRHFVSAWAGEAFCVIPETSSIDTLAEYFRERIISGASWNTIDRLLDERAGTVADQVREHVRAPRVLDCGCGDARIAFHLKPGCAITIADLEKRYHHSDVASLPFVELKEGEDLPFEDGSFDTCLLLTVLHHSYDPVRVLRNAMRVARRVVIIESVVDVTYADPAKFHELPESIARAAVVAAMPQESQRAFAAFADFIYNRCIFRQVPVPFNFNSPKNWESLIESLGGRVTVSQSLGVDQVLVPEVHHLLVADSAD